MYVCVFGTLNLQKFRKSNKWLQLLHYGWLSYWNLNELENIEQKKIDNTAHCPAFHINIFFLLLLLDLSDLELFNSVFVDSKFRFCALLTRFDLSFRILSSFPSRIPYSSQVMFIRSSMLRQWMVIIVYNDSIFRCFCLFVLLHYLYR